MGSRDGADDERPIHRVELSAFEIGVYQVTNAEWSRYLDAQRKASGLGPRASVGKRSRETEARGPRPEAWFQQPVVAVSWFDAVNYCDWLSVADGRRFRLPTEAEWECAARGGVEGARYPWGDERPPDDGRWVNGPERAGRGAPNGYGLHDVCTNVHEWCNDWYGADSYALSPPRDPRGPAVGTRRVSRGGSWRHQVKVSRCAARSSIPPAFRYADYGFRIACGPD